MLKSATQQSWPGHRVCPVRSVLHEVRMAAINGCHRKRQKEIADGLASAETRLIGPSTLAQANATDQLKKAKAEAQVIIEQANKRRARRILDEAKAEAEQERN